MQKLNFIGKDIGNVLKLGSTEKVTGGYDIIASGEDIWEKSDAFHFAYTEQTGDFDLIAQIESLSEAHLYTKAGLMARESTEYDSKHVFILVFPDNSPRNNNNGGYEFQFRDEKGGSSEAIYPSDFVSLPPKFPVNFPNTWVRLKRNHNEFTAFYSCDGTHWKEYAKHSLEMNSKLCVGLALTSHNNNETTVCKFRNISI